MDTSKYKTLYLKEAQDHLAGIEAGLLGLEKDPSNQSIVDNLFRHHHSIKGMSASMGYVPIQRLAHAGEDLLDSIRSKKLPFSSAVSGVLFSCLDKLKGLVKGVESDAPQAEESEIEPYIRDIKGVMDGTAQEAKTPESPAKTPAPYPAADAGKPAGETELRLSNIMKIEGRVFDDLLTTAGDLFMSLSSMRTLSQTLRSIEFKDGVFLLGKTIGKLHSSILSARMLPVEDLIEGLPRIIRDISSRGGKSVLLKTEGVEISLDRAILENLSAPLVHIIRNSVDHGIETPEERRSAGKPPEGTITIKASARKDKVVISVSDDGRGIDIEKVKSRAAARGVSLEKLRSMTDREALMLVCLPGLSSADEVTETSGRGVGMDVVRSAVESMGGNLRIETVKGKGTWIIMELPRTTSIMKALTVRVSEEVFLLPVSKIDKVIETEGGSLSGGAFTYDGKDIPLIRLSEALGMDAHQEGRFCTVIVIEGAAAEGAERPDKDRFGIVVDDFGDEIDAYIKPLTPPMHRVWGVSGIAIMGDGRPVLLVDIAQIASKMKAGAGGQDLL